MKGLIKHVIGIFAALAMLFVIFSRTPVQLPVAETYDPIIFEDVTNEIPRRLREDILNATVKVETSRNVYGSGIYMRHGRDVFVITAAHVVRGAQSISIRIGEQIFVDATLLYLDSEADIAILDVDGIPARMPIKFRPRPGPIMPGESVAYAGLPNSHNIMLVSGEIAGYERSGQSMIVHSYAWKGTSGSGVFDYRGRLVGIVVAIDVATMPLTGIPRIVEDIVWVTPINCLNENQLSEILSQ
jgi:S1-C subfamily serine protease|tara:strand:+ start:335 stop:1063 length:729 start_codon:yes stop_codon:yes gene_type:complete